MRSRKHAFAVLEILIADALCRWFYRHLDDCERVVIERDRARVLERRGAEISRHEFARHWARVVLDGERPARLRIGSHGKRGEHRARGARARALAPLRSVSAAGDRGAKCFGRSVLEYEREIKHACSS